MKICKSILCLFAALLMCSCVEKPTDSPWPNKDGNGPFERSLVLLSLGYNDLQGDLEKNITELCSGEIPDKRDNKAVFVFRHASLSGSDMSTLCAPHIMRIYREKGKVVLDTLKLYEPNTVSASAETISDALSFIDGKFTTESYGLVFSSHASGWMPWHYEREGEDFIWSRSPASADMQANWWKRERWQPIPTKSLGVQCLGSRYNPYYQIDLEAFSDALPFHLDYLIIDSCLCGGVEVAYALKDKCRYIIASPTETLTYGHVYQTMCTNLLYSEDLREALVKTCREYFDRYDAMSGSYRSATIAMYDCSLMDELAGSTAALVNRYREQIEALNRNNIQDYNYNYDVFYDFRDILYSASRHGDGEHIAAVDKVLEELVIYKAATEKFIGHSIDPDRYSGMSMYLPYSDRPNLNAFYRELGWNKATGLLL